MKKSFFRKSGLFAMCVLVFLMLLVAGCGKGDDETTLQVTTIDNGWNGKDYISMIGAAGSNYYAQSFIANMSTITKIGVVIRQITPEGEVKIGIAADNGGVPNYAAPLYMGELITPTADGVWYYETGLHVPVTRGQKYFILIDGYDNAGATGRSAIGVSDVQPISGEGMIYSNSGGVGIWGSTPPIAIYVEGY